MVFESTGSPGLIFSFDTLPACVDGNAAAGGVVGIGQVVDMEGAIVVEAMSNFARWRLAYEAVARVHAGLVLEGIKSVEGEELVGSL